jgi:hypothetical protein
MGVRQRTFGPPGGKARTMPVSAQRSSRFGPIHCGQSSARNAETTVINEKHVRNLAIMVTSS